MSYIKAPAGYIPTAVFFAMRLTPLATNTKLCIAKLPVADLPLTIIVINGVANLVVRLAKFILALACIRREGSPHNSETRKDTKTACTKQEFTPVGRDGRHLFPNSASVSGCLHQGLYEPLLDGLQFFEHSSSQSSRLNVDSSLTIVP
jgi:hypothetical protein